MYKKKIKINFLKDLLPPIILRWIKKKNPSSTFEISKVYKSYDVALKKSESYEDFITTKVVVAKAKNFSRKLIIDKKIDLMSLRPLIFILKALKSNTLKVIDFGGAAGNHYQVVRSVLGNSIKIDWRVVETKSMVKEALEQELQTEELKFYNSIAQASNNEVFDLVFSSGAIHHVPNPYKCLQTLASINASYLILTKTPMAEQDIVLLQRSLLSENGSGKMPEIGILDRVIRHPVTILNKKKVEEILDSFGEIELQINEEKKAYQSPSSSYDFSGYVVRKFQKQL